MRHAILVQLFVVLLLAIAPAASRAQSDAALRIEIPGRPPALLSLAEIAAFPETTVDAADHGKSGRWTGVPVRALLEKAGASLGEAMRGPALAQVVVVEAADGYRAAFALAEFDVAFGASAAILATSRADGPLAEGEGPLRIVVPGERRQARWVRQVTAIRVVAVP